MHGLSVIIVALALSLGIYAAAAQRGANIVKLDTKTVVMSAIWGILEMGAACAGYGIGRLILTRAETSGPAQFWIKMMSGFLLILVGGRMLLQAFEKKTLLEHRMESVDLKHDSLLSLRICLQALFVGIACGLLDTQLVFWMIAIFVLSLIFAGIGYISGRAYGPFLINQAVGAGGVLLCLCGILLQIRQL